MKNDWRVYQNYIIIALLSMLSVFVLPMLGTSIGLGFNFPATPAGWIVYICTKLCMVVINILIFDQFMKQAKVNVRDNPKYIEAEKILLENIKKDEQPPRAASVMIHEMYRSKAITTAIFSILGVFGFTNAILTFDWVSMISYMFTIIIGIVFGWISMNNAEIIWTDNHLAYARYKQSTQKVTESKENQAEI